MTQQVPSSEHRPGPPTAYTYAPAGPAYPPAPGPAYFAGSTQQPGGPSYPPGPPPGKSRVLIVGIVAGAVVLLAAIGAVVMVLHQQPPQPTVITPSTSTQPGPTTAPPTNQPSDPPSQQPSTGPTAAPPPTQAPDPSRVELADNIGVVPAPLYKLQDKGPGYASFSNGNDLFIARVIKLAADTEPGRRCVDELTSVNQGASALKIPPPQPVNGNPSLKIATCQSSAIYSDGGGSRIAYAGSVVSVRLDDGVTVVGTVLFNTSSVPAQVNQDVSAMVNSMLHDQSRR